jgi:hypothetical protein
MDTTTTEPKKYRTITLTDRPPIKIIEAHWPMIAHGSARSNECHHTPTPNYETDGYNLRVRQHADGRTIVYGILDASPAWTGSEDYRGGVLLAPGADVPAAIRRVGAECGLPDRVIRECIADLPAEQIE